MYKIYNEKLRLGLLSSKTLELIIQTTSHSALALSSKLLSDLLMFGKTIWLSEFRVADIKIKYSYTFISKC